MAVRGNLVVGQSGGPTAVINNSLVGVVHEAMQHEEIGGIYGMLHGITGVLNEEFTDLRQESARTLTDLCRTPAAALGSVRYKVTDKDYDRLLDVLQAYGIRYFFYIGGNDSMDTTHKISQAAADRGYELYAVGVPKTIDNDLALTDHCPGYGSAARFVAAAIRNTAFDTRAMGDSGPIKLMEIMGRNAGWLAAATALAKETEDDAPHLIYVPERPVTVDRIVSDVRSCYEENGFCIMAASEGLTAPGGQLLFGNTGPVHIDAFGHASKEGIVEGIAAVIRSELGIKARVDKPGYLQRSFAQLVSPVDREEAYTVGRVAVQAAVAGETGKMVTLVRKPTPDYQCVTGLVPLEKVANAERQLPPEFINSAGNGVTDAFLEYARPLIGGPLLDYGRLTVHRVSRVRR